MTRIDPNPNLVDIDPEIERTLRLIRNARRRIFNTSFGVEDSSVVASSSVSNSAHPIFTPTGSSSSNFDSISASCLVDSVHLDYSVNMNDNRTLKELAIPNINYQPLCI